MAELIRRGRAHVFGDDVTLDDGIIPARFAAQRVLDPALLTPHLFENVDPGFAQRVQRGDIIVAGQNFASGKPRLQGFIAMAALDLSIVCTSMPFKMLRRAVARALPTLTGVSSDIAATGDELEIDFAQGQIRNITRGTTSVVAPMPPILLDLVATGGANAALKAWLNEHPEQALQP